MCNNKSNKKEPTEPIIPSYEVLSKIYTGLHYECQRQSIEFNIADVYNYYPLLRLYKCVSDFFMHESASSIIERHMDNFQTLVIKEGIDEDEADSNTKVDFNYYDIVGKFYELQLFTTLITKLSECEEHISGRAVISKLENKVA